MHSNLGQRPNIRARNSIFSGVKDGCWFYRWFQVHSFILLIKALFTPLVKEDMFNLKEQFWPETLYMQFGRLKKMNPHHSCAKIVYQIIKVDMIIACVLAFFEAGSNFAGPIIIRFILIYLNKPAETTTIHDRNIAFALAGLWIFFCIIQILLKEYWTRLASLCATKIQVILETQFYRQTTRVSSTYKKYMNLGDFYSFWFVDVTNITGFIINFPNIISAPTILIFSVIFVCLEVGPYGLLLLAVIVLAIIIELLIDLNMSSIFAHKLSKYDMKLAENMHMYKEFKEMKELGWESLLIKQNIRYRHSENVLNRIYYILGQIYLTITNFAPVLIIFILILVGAYSQNQISWGTTVVFTVIGYISTITIPLRNLPNIITRLFVTRRIFKRIQNFLKADQIVTNEDISLQTGSFVIKKWVLSIGTRSSIDRLLVRESIMIEGQQSMIAHIKNLPIEVRMYHTLDFISRQEINKFKRLMKCVQVPYKLSYKKGDVVILLGQKSGSGKTSFIRGFLGSLYTQSGYLKYNGKLGFISVSDFYFEKSIKQNVMFGEYYDKQRLQKAYKLSGLDQEILKYTKKDDTIVTTNPNVVAQSLRCIISLARAIYYDADILLMDDLFDEFEIDQLKTLYNRICTNLSDKLIVISTNLIHFLKQSDNVIILENRCAIEVGKFGSLIQDPESKIHSFRITDLQIIHYRSLVINGSPQESTSSQENSSVSIISKLAKQVGKVIEQGRQREIQEKRIEKKLNTFNQVLTETSLYMLGEIKSDDLAPPLPPTTYPIQRPSNVQYKYYFALFKNGGWMYVITFLFICLANAVATFSTWLIGSLTRHPFGLGVDGALILYACLQVLFAILLLIYGMFVPKVATLNIELMSNEFNDMISRASLEQFQKYSSVHLTYVFGGDNHNFYNICDNITNVFTSTVTLISTVIIMGLASHYIFIVGGAVIFYSVIAYYIFRIAAQEVFVLGGGPKRYFFKALQDSVDGAETFQFYDKVEWFKTKVYDGIYMFSAVWRTNLRFMNHAFNILCGIAELILMAGIMYLAIAKKQKFSSETVIYVNVAVTASPRILGSIFMLFNNLANMAAVINTTIKIPYECFHNKYQKNYNYPLKPANWPWNGRIQLRSVSVERKQISYPLLDNISLTITHGEVVGICSDYDNDVNLLFQLLNGFINPSKNDGSYAGDVIISDMNISQFGQICNTFPYQDTTEAVALLDTNPLCFNGTIRYNLDPFNRYSDQQIQKALEAVKFWDQISTDNDNRFIQQFKTLNYVIEERGEQLPTAAAQKLNFARAYLKKPKILLMERAMSKIETSRSEFFYSMVRKVFKNSTVILLTLDLHYLMRCDRILTLRKGKIIEDGHPRDLAVNPESRIYQMIKVLADSDYLKRDKGKDTRQSL